MAYNNRQMSQQATSHRQAQHRNPIEIGLLLLPAFNSMAVNAFIDPFRAANYLRGFPLYQWHFLSLDGQPVTASNGFVVAETVEWTG